LAHSSCNPKRTLTVWKRKLLQHPLGVWLPHQNWVPLDLHLVQALFLLTS